MKTVKNILSIKWMALLAMLVMVAFSSCTDDEENVVEPVFPDLKALSGEVGQTLDITFSANMDWTMTSNAAWCKFVDGEFMEATASGKAGDQNLKVQILADESWNTETEDIAELSLAMGKNTQVVYKITRGKKTGQNLVITDAEGNVYDAQHPLTIKGSGLRDVSIDSVYTVVTVPSEMEVGITEKPDWLYVENMGNGIFRFIFDKGKENVHGKSPIFSFSNSEDKVIFATAEGNQTVEVPVNYEGLKAGYLELKDAVADGYPSDLYVSEDGATFTAKTTNLETGAVEVGETFNAPLKTTVTSRDNAFHVLAIDLKKGEAPNMAPYNILNVTEEGVDWVETSVNGTELELTVKALQDENRGAMVMVFSQAYWEEILSDSIAKYGSLQDALTYSELIYRPAEGSGDPEIYGDNLRNEYAGNVWVNVFQEKEASSSDISFNGLLDMGSGEMTFDEIQYNMGSEFASIVPFTGDLGIGTDNVYMANMSSEILTYGTVYFEVVNYSDGMTFEVAGAIPGVAIKDVDYKGKKCISVSGENTGSNYAIVKVKNGGTVVAACIVQFY